MGVVLGNKSVPWLWRFAKKRVLEGLADGLGDSTTRRLITEYHARQATVDFGEWSGAIIGLLDGAFGTSIQQEWQPASHNVDPWIATPYVKTTNSNNELTPDPLTLPGWSGANLIPLTVSDTATRVIVDFNPLGENMTCQLVYRSTKDNAVYSQFVSKGECNIRLDEHPANAVIIALITNNDFLYLGEETRKAKFDYKLKLTSGITGTASINTRWYKWNSLTGGNASLQSSLRRGVDWSKYCTYPAAPVNL